MVATCKISVAALLNMFATSKSYGNMCCFDQKYQPGEITLQVSALIIKYLVAIFLDKVTCRPLHLGRRTANFARALSLTEQKFAGYRNCHD